jgi:hypothetical protein
MVVVEMAMVALAVVEMAMVALAMAEMTVVALAMVEGLWCRVHHHPSYTLLSTDTVEHS